MASKLFFLSEEIYINCTAHENMLLYNPVSHNFCVCTMALEDQNMELIFGF